MIYLDHAATTQISDTALEVYVNVAKHYFGNPNSLHDIGSDAQQLLEASRRTVAKIIECEADEIIFTSGGSESNQFAIKALLSSSEKEKKHIITSSVEHSSISNFFEKLSEDGYEVSVISVDENGRIDLEELGNLITQKTALVSIQHANSETGVIQDIEGIGALCRKKDVLLHSDCVQTFCKIGIDSSWVDALSVSSHKIYGPKGVGAFYLKKGIDFTPEIKGTTQEKGLKAGTQNVPGIAAFAAAAKNLYAERAEEYYRMSDFKERLISKLRELGFEFIEEGDVQNRLPNIIGLRFPGIEGQYLMLESSQAGLGISTGSACQIGSNKPNKTMKAMGRTDDEAMQFVRLSLGKQNSEEQIEVIIEKIDTILKRHFSKIKF